MKSASVPGRIRMSATSSTMRTSLAGRSARACPGVAPSGSRSHPSHLAHWPHECRTDHRHRRGSGDRRAGARSWSSAWRTPTSPSTAPLGEHAARRHGVEQHPGATAGGHERAAERRHPRHRHAQAPAVRATTSIAPSTSARDLGASVADPHRRRTARRRRPPPSRRRRPRRRRPRSRGRERRDDDPFGRHRFVLGRRGTRVSPRRGVRLPVSGFTGRRHPRAHGQGALDVEHDRHPAGLAQGARRRLAARRHRGDRAHRRRRHVAQPERIALGDADRQLHADPGVRRATATRARGCPTSARRRPTGGSARAARSTTRTSAARRAAAFNQGSPNEHLLLRDAVLQLRGRHRLQHPQLAGRRAPGRGQCVLPARAPGRHRRDRGVRRRSRRAG